MPIENQDQTDLDTSAAIADISADLFGQGGERGEAENKGQTEAGAEASSAEPTAVEAPPSQQTADKTGQEPSSLAPDQSPDNSQQVQDIGAPKTWSKEALQDWATLPPRAQQEILKREEDFLKGITMYKDRAEIGDQYEQVISPYKPILQAENIDPVQMFQSFVANHYILSRGTEAQKLELAANMIAGYHIPVDKLLDFIGDRVIEPADPRVSALEAEIRELKNANQSRQQQDQAAIQERLSKEIEAFAQDSAHPYFSELVDDISKLFEIGQATNLQEAYDKAVYLNPTTRQKEIDRLTALKSNSVSAEEQARRDKIAKSTAADLSLDPKSKNGTVPIGSIDDTLAETMARIQGRS